MTMENPSTSAEVEAEEATADDRAVAVATPTGHSRKARAVGFAEAYTLPAVIVLLIVFFSVWPATSETFLTMANLNAVASSQGVIAILTLAALIPLVANRYDLSVGANMGLSSVVAATVMAHGYGLIPGLLAGMGTGIAVGLINGVIIAYLKINDVVTTLGTTIIIVGIVSWITEGRPIAQNISTGLIDFTSAIVWGIPAIVVVVAVIAIAVHMTFEYTSPGRRLFMLGSNENAARLIGLRTSVLIMGSFAAAGLLAGFAGVMQLGRAGGALPSVGDSFTLPALAAAFLSQAAIKPGRVNVGGAITAIIFLAVLNAGLNLAGAPPFINNFVNGAALILGVGLAVYIGKIRDSFAKKV